MTITEFTNDQGRFILQIQRTEMILERARLWPLSETYDQDRARLSRLISYLDAMIVRLGGSL